MSVQLFAIRRRAPGTLSTMARPRGGDWLHDEMSDLRSKGVTTLVSFLSPEEIATLELANEAGAAASQGINFISFPIGDRSTTTVESYLGLLKTVELDLQSGGHVVGHCRMGIGRASMFAAAVLVREGASPDDAWVAISEARGLPVPDTEEQRLWVTNFSPNH